jgi:hypothetical protein
MAAPVEAVGRGGGREATGGSPALGRARTGEARGAAQPALRQTGTSSSGAARVRTGASCTASGPKVALSSPNSPGRRSTRNRSPSRNRCVPSSATTSTATGAAPGWPASTPSSRAIASGSAARAKRMTSGCPSASERSGGVTASAVSLTTSSRRSTRPAARAPRPRRAPRARPVRRRPEHDLDLPGEVLEHPGEVGVALAGELLRHRRQHATDVTVAPSNARRARRPSCR